MELQQKQINLGKCSQEIKKSYEEILDLIGQIKKQRHSSLDIQKREDSN